MKDGGWERGREKQIGRGFSILRSQVSVPEIGGWERGREKQIGRGFSALRSPLSALRLPPTSHYLTILPSPRPIVSPSARLPVSPSPYGYPLKAGQIRRYKKELRSFLSRFAMVALPTACARPQTPPGR
jgi:hypothetical protein